MRTRVALLALGAFDLLIACPAAHAQTVLFWGTPGQAAVAQMALNLQSVVANMSNLTGAKADLYRQILQARQELSSACKSKRRDAAAEAHFVSMLEAKDLYYLPFYMQSFDNAHGVTSALQRATGGEVDGGIRPEARFAFTSWAVQMKAALGKSTTGDTLGTQAAIQHTQPAYLDYVRLRDRAEINEITNGEAELLTPDPTPEQYADLYVEKVLKPARDSGRAMPSGYKPLTDEVLGEFRTTIIEWENIKLDPEKIAKVTLSGYDDAVVQVFLSTAKRAEDDPKTYHLRLIKAYDDAFVADLKRHGVATSIAPGDAVQLSRLKYASDPEAALRFAKLDPRSNYISSRENMKKDMVPEFDWCTGQKL